MPTRLTLVTRWLTNLQHTLATHWQSLAAHVLRILLIIVLVLVARRLINRAIRRLTTTAADGGNRSMTRPLRDHALPGLLEDSPLLFERRKQRAETISSILRSVTTFAAFGLATMLILSELQINIGPIIASAGIIGLAVGFGAQNLVKDFLSGIFMILEDQYGVADFIDVGDATGRVEAVGLRTTRIRDEYGTVWYVRNGEIVRIGNKSQGYAKVVLDVPLAHHGNVEQAGQIMKETADAMWQDPDWAGVVLEEPTYLGVEEITADGVLLRLTGKTRPGEQWRVGRELRSRLKERFDLDDVATAYTSTPVYVRTDQAAAT